MRQRRSLTHVGGSVETEGRSDVARLLAEALDVAPARVPGDEDGAKREPPAEDDPERAHIHGFHTYPARMHPTTAARLVRGLAGQPGDTVLDPFCGSGTVLVEAMIADRRSIGVDLNPLAVKLARLKTGRRDPPFREAIAASALDIAAFAAERRLRRAGSTRRYPPEDVAAFDPHVLLELDSLRAGIAGLPEDQGDVREALELTLSAILVKVSRRVSDTSGAQSPRRIAAGYTAKLFARKASELARRLGELAALVAGASPARVLQDDAARLRAFSASSVDVVVTSPPYASTHDYLSHHALRMRWLGLDPRGFEAGEMGSRRRYARVDPRVGREMWVRELGALFKALSRVCRKGARVALLLADSAIGDEAVRADDVVARVAPEAGFTPVARASQRRPYFHGPTARAFRDAPRAEHALALEKR